jgi:hypothetical protein
LIYEPFVGYTAGPIHNQLPNANTIGLDKNVAWTVSGSGTQSIDFASTGLSFANLATSGGGLSRTFSGVKNVGAQLALSSAFTGNLYESYLANVGTLTSVSTEALFTTFGDALTGNTGRHFRASAESSGPGAFIATRYDGNASTVGSGGIDRSTTYIMLARYTNVGGDTSVTPGVATVFALTADQFTHFKSLGMNDADLDAATIGTASDNVTAKATDTLTTGTVTLPSNYFFQLITTNDAANTTGLLFDELRYGLSFADVTPLAPAGVPGDFNSDNKVDAGDYVTWRKADGGNNPLANDNGLGTPIGASHYNLWRANFGNPSGAGSGTSLGPLSAVPEPDTCALVVIVGWLTMLARRNAAA